MIVPAAVFTCSICGEPSTNICAYCTKDACANHRCVRCKRCSDCCECEVPLSAEEPVPEPEVVVVEAPANIVVEPDLPTEPEVITELPVDVVEPDESLERSEHDDLTESPEEASDSFEPPQVS
jgi:hypothetical protein